MGRRDHLWHMYWYLGRGFRHANVLKAHEPVPGRLAELDAGAVGAACWPTSSPTCGATGGSTTSRGSWCWSTTHSSAASTPWRWNPRVLRPLQGLDRLTGLPEVVEQEQRRGTTPP